MAEPLDTFKLLVPETADYTDAQLESFLGIAGDYVSTTVFGEKYNEAISYLAGHFLILASTTGDAPSVNAAGPLIGERAGEVARQYGFSQQSRAKDDMLSRTTYGNMYRFIQSSVVKTRMLATRGNFG